jgi:hypothetical protein
MTGPEPPEPKSADLIAADPTTALPWEVVRDVLRDTRLYWLATVHPRRPPPRPPGAGRLGRRRPLQHLHQGLPQRQKPGRRPALHGYGPHRHHGCGSRGHRDASDQ